MESYIYWIWFAELKRISKAEKAKLLTFYKHPKVLYENAKDYGLHKDLSRAVEIANLNHKYGIKTMTPDDSNHQTHMPELLYYQGKPFKGIQSAVVGTRSSSIQGEMYTKRVCEEQIHNGVCINSGLAKGIDIIAHKTAIDSGGITQAFLAHGLDKCYPRDHLMHKERILEKGAVFSPFPVGTSPMRHHFIQRNQLMAAFSDEIIVIEAPLRSGSLTTAEYGWQYQKNVLTIKGTNSPRCAGNQKLLERGAGIVDVPTPHYIGPNEQYIKLLRNEPMAFSKIMNIVRQNDDDVALSLLDLEATGWISHKADGRWHYNGW